MVNQKALKAGFISLLHKFHKWQTDLCL